MRFILYYGLFLISILCFLYGYFPLQSYFLSNKFSINSTQHDDGYQIRQPAEKLVLMIIDALRFDFVNSTYKAKYMPFTTSVLGEKNGCLIVTKADAPTVTMPRLKAMMTGHVPNFIDIILNLGSAAITENNFVTYAKSKGLRVVFYGDDTWIKMFPDTFLRSEGTTSFYVSDFVEVDSNVTRHLDVELLNDDWDILILHYLGLDHIGHIQGPFSPLVQPKLNEMDSVIRRLWIFLKDWEKRTSKQSLLIVSGDHGMKDSGGHGGVSYAEVMVPVISLQHPCYHMPGWPDNMDHIPLQIDIAPTLSFLLGLPLSPLNMGKLIPQLLYGRSKHEILKGMFHNKKQLLQLQNPSKSDSTSYQESDQLFHRWYNSNLSDAKIAEEITVKYFHELSHLSETVSKSSQQLNMPLVILSCLFMWLLLFIFLLHSQFLTLQRSFISYLLYSGTILHTFSFASTSFIEEEHQTWYFLWISLVILAILDSLRSKDLNTLLRNSLNWFIIGIMHRILRKLNQTGDKWAGLPDIADFLNLESGQPWLLASFVVGLLGVLWCCYLEDNSTTNVCLSFLSVMSIFGYRLAVGSLNISGFNYYYSSRGSQEARLFWLTFIVILIRSIWRRSSLHTSWCLLMSLLYRPHNTILVPLQVYFSLNIHKLFYKPDDGLLNSIAHVWLGNLFYFYQGNSNSIANIDVAAGYVGLDSYQPVYVGLLLLAHTYSSPILSYLLASHRVTSVVCLSRMVPVTLFSTLLIIQRHHLFIWSVFAPKLLYESCYTFVTFLLLFTKYFSV